MQGVWERQFSPSRHPAWAKHKVLDRIWARWTVKSEALGGINYEWQAADTAMGKAPFLRDLIALNPTDRGKKDVKRSLPTERDGDPFAAAVSGANSHLTMLLSESQSPW